MPVPTIFLIDQNGEFVEMYDQPYDSERLLQELLAKYPSVLAGDQFSGDAPVRWLFVAREAGIPDTDGGSDRWSLDHIFLDQNGVPTFIEVKRSSDTRIRREVVGQMLDYAANAVRYWPDETIRRQFEETCLERGLEPEVVASEFVGSVDVEHFWTTVKTNLRAGKVRLIFAADEIPAELRRVVEFLNEQMNPAEVLAIEIRQYIGKGVRTLVPRVIQSVKRATAATAQSAKAWDRESFMEALLKRRGQECAALAGSILNWTTTHGLEHWWGRGQRDGSCYPGFRQAENTYYPFAIWTYGRIEIQFHLLRQRLVPEALIEAFAHRLAEIPGTAIPAETLPRRFPFEMALLRPPEALQQFLETLEWFTAQLRTAGER
jgi:hypothetical protein